MPRSMCCRRSSPARTKCSPTLRERGYRIGLISNTGRTPGYALREILDRLGLASSIDAMVFSNEHGACKPQPSIFATLRDALDVDYDEMMFVGDNLYVDVHGAQRLGITGVHFDPPDARHRHRAAVEHGLEIVPHATIRDLRELLDVVSMTDRADPRLEHPRRNRAVLRRPHPRPLSSRADVG